MEEDRIPYKPQYYSPTGRRIPDRPDEAENGTGEQA
jgi:hypothetical protein